MNSSVICVSEILSAAKYIFSAGFSVGYSFDEVNASEYFEELIENSSYQSPIFSGILILKKIDADYTIIDGLQRLTTISLLLCALCEIYKGTTKNNEDAREKVLSRFLLNGEDVKLKIASEEQEVYKKLLFSVDLTEEEKNNNLVKTYQCFLEKVREHRISGTKLFKIISRIQFMTIITDDSEVSASDLYQTLNANKDKSQVNLISDFIYKKDEQSAKLWQNTVEHYKDLNLQHLLADFIKDFLNIQNDGKILDKSILYNNFKSYFIKLLKYRKSAEIIENFCKYAQFYLKIINADFEDEEIKNQIVTLNQNNGKAAYPYLMEVLEDLEDEHIERGVFLDILKMINSFIEQQPDGMTVDMTVNFASLGKEINKMLILKDYVPNINAENNITINEINHLSTFEV